MVRAGALLFAAGLAIFIGIASAVFFLKSGNRPPESTGAATSKRGGPRQKARVPAPPRVPATPATPAETAPEGEVALRFVVSPPEALVQVGGEAVPLGNVLKLAKQKRALPVTATAEGYLPYQSEVIPSADQTLNIALLPDEDAKADGSRQRAQRRHRRGKEK
jgi:hypothetical protein